MSDASGPEEGVESFSEENFREHVLGSLKCISEALKCQAALERENLELTNQVFAHQLIINELIGRELARNPDFVSRTIATLDDALGRMLISGEKASNTQHRAKLRATVIEILETLDAPSADQPKEPESRSLLDRFRAKGYLPK